MRIRQFVVVFTALVALALTLAACGGDPTATAGPTGGTGATAGATAAVSTPAGVAPSPTAATGAPAAPTATSTTAPTAAAAGATATTGGGGATPCPAAAPAATGGAEKYTIVPDASTARYKVDEVFFGRGLATAIGTTSAIAGDLYLDRQRVSASRIDTITVDISRLTSDSSQRDNRIRRSWLESSRFPQATFVTKRLEGLPDGPYTEGQELTFKIVGDLTVRTVTREVTWDARGKLQGDTFTGTATTNFNMTDFGFEPPEIAGTLKAENGVIVELELQARRAS